MKTSSILIAVCVALAATSVACRPGQAAAPEPDKYLFAYFTGNDRADEAIRFAVSENGYDWKALNGNLPVIGSDTISETGGVRDPHILRRHDGQGFYMVVTDMVSANGWDSNRGMVLLKSPDLKNWTATAINIQNTYEGQDSLLRVWAPQTIYDPEAGKYMIYWSMKHGNGPDIIYYSYANDDFTALATEPKQLFFPADGNSCIDADIVPYNGKYYMFYKTEDNGNGIRLALADSLTSGQWEEKPGYKQLTDNAVEGAGVFQLADSSRYILMYDVYIQGGYEFTESTDLENFTPASQPVTMDFHPRHGSVISITPAEYDALLEAFPAPVAQ